MRVAIIAVAIEKPTTPAARSAVMAGDMPGEKVDAIIASRPFCNKSRIAIFMNKPWR
ncbi:hypothetical protein GCM10010924_15180 [Rhizobium wenxiniae]|nr:hypothetical protein GCM10010924_15180 [Rhizobium wenxiniae]